MLLSGVNENDRGLDFTIIKLILFIATTTKPPLKADLEAFCKISGDDGVTIYYLLVFEVRARAGSKGQIKHLLRENRWKKSRLNLLKLISEAPRSNTYSSIWLLEAQQVHPQIICNLFSNRLLIKIRLQMKI